MKRKMILFVIAIVLMMALGACADGTGLLPPAAPVVAPTPSLPPAGQGISNTTPITAPVTGPAGPVGPQGPIGPQGPKGDTGPQGPAGQNITTTSSITPVVTLPSWQAAACAALMQPGCPGYGGITIVNNNTNINNNGGTGCPTCAGTGANNIVTNTRAAQIPTCPVGQFVQAGPKITVQFNPGTWYHINVSVRGNAAFIENNVLVNPKTPFTMTFDGNVYSYATLPTANCQLFTETAGDTWHKVSALPDSLVEYAFPVGTSGTEGGEIIFNVAKADGSVVFSAAPAIKNGIVAQSQGTATTSGTIVKGAWAGLSWYKGGPETVFLFQATSDVVVSNFQGTLSQWDHKPTADEVGGKPRSTLAEVKNAGITLTPENAVSPFSAQ